jgi:peptide/nickel transport system ATP-binding protein/oligopeptide transport system ATP-binding protein
VSNSILSLQDVSVHFAKRKGGQTRTVQAAAGVTMDLAPGEILGLVGESGSGKSTVGTAAIGLQALTLGQVTYRGQPLPAQGSAQWRALRRQLQIVFQDPFSALNPRRTIADALSEPLRLHRLVSKNEEEHRIAELLEQVGLDPALMKRHPAALSGGQRQRVCFARALAVEPEVIICDEVTSALDVSTQAQIVSLIRKLRDETGIAFLFISHDLGVVRNLADRVMVMYLGRIAEQGRTGDIFAKPLHPYTQALIAAAPVPDPAIEMARDHTPLTGDIPDPADPPSGCRFHTRCVHAQDLCRAESPELIEAGQQSVACHFWKEISEAKATRP